MMRFLLPIVLGYFLGSIPTGYWIGKIQGVDVRQHGSGNLGATNVFRTLGWKAGLTTLLFDIAKGFVAVWIFLIPASHQTQYSHLADPVTFAGPEAWLAGIAAIAGHSFSCWVGFRGGKGVATAAGVFIGLLPIPAIVALITFGIVFGVSQIVSLASIIAAVALAITTGFTSHNALKTGITAALCVFVIWRHRSNITRLLNGSEPKLRWGGKKVAA
jgi:acyl phosphate:glycerol-3-phosphate acyltransferase